MSDRIKGFHVTFRQDVSEEYAAKVQQAIEMLAEVIHVEPVKAQFEDHIIEMRVRCNIATNIHKVIFP